MPDFTQTDKFNNLNPKIRSIMNILLAHEKHLSDGYLYYCALDFDDEAKERWAGDHVACTLEAIAKEILKSMQ